jgi:lipopolysaccharide export system permease protein
MTAANEVIALKSAGVSIYRILYVVALPALVMSFLTLGLGETLVPYFNKKRMAIYREKVEKIPKTSVTRRGRIYMVDGRDRIVHIGHYNAENLTGFNINIQTVKDNTLLSRLDASRMRYSKDHWVLFNAVKRDFAGDSVRMEKIYAYDWRELNFKPEDLLKIQSKPEEMNYWELREFIDKLISTGSDAIRWRVDLNNKLATPFAVLVIVIFGVPIAVVKRRSGLMVGFGISLLVCFLYFGVTKSIQILGYKSLLPPLLSAWSGNAIFLIVGLMAVVKVGK